jgi:hypothetical protein
MKKHKAIEPEMMKLFKIFGIGTLVWVFVLSFFNEKRETEDRSPTAITAASRLYFMNVRQPFYDRENRMDAKMNIFRFSKREKDAELPAIGLSIIINRIKDDAYVFVEPSEKITDLVMEMRYVVDEEIGEISFLGGDRFAHFEFVEKVYPLLLKDARFELKLDEVWVPILEGKRERDAFRITSFDYFRLIEREEMNQ